MTDSKIFDTAIIGGRPAAPTAGPHAARIRPNVLFPGRTALCGRMLTYHGAENYTYFREGAGASDHAAEKAAITSRNWDEIRATSVIQEKAFQNEKISFILCNVVKEIEGGPRGVPGFSLHNLTNSQYSELPVSGEFAFEAADLPPNPFFRKLSGIPQASSSPAGGWLRRRAYLQRAASGPKDFAGSRPKQAMERRLPSMPVVMSNTF